MIRLVIAATLLILASHFLNGKLHLRRTLFRAIILIIYCGTIKLFLVTLLYYYDIMSPIDLSLYEPSSGLLCNNLNTLKVALLTLTKLRLE